MIVIIGLVIWFLASCFFIYKDYDETIWGEEVTFKIWFFMAVVCTILSGSGVYDPTQSTLSFIDVNPTWGLGIIIGIIEATLITGPFAALHYIIHKIKDLKER